ncbi:MFS transporter [Oenococcus sp. UCMA 16435]|nr:MFS transporter [Oenococcus sp. UCMA 16435]MDI4583823.1 MFS transporter [Oenococcus sp. UCMA 14587]
MENAFNLEKRIDLTKESPLFYKIFGLVSVGMLLDAADVYMASAVVSSTLKKGWSTIQEDSYFLSAGFLGLFIGSIIAGFIGDFKGRRTAYKINLLIFGTFTFIAAFSPNMWVLIICRLIASIGLGSEIVTGYSMINEFAPIHSRGKWCANTSLIANCGAPITLLLCTAIIPRFGWRIMFVSIGIIAGILWFLRRGIPESPRWLLARGRCPEAEKIIQELEHGNKKEDTKQKKAKNKIIKNSSLKKSLFVAIVAVSATVVCQYTFTSWVPTLLVKQGINISKSLGLSTLMMLGAPIGCAFGAYLIDRVGRKMTIVPTFLLTAIFGILYAKQDNLVGVVMIGFLLTVCFYVLMASVVAVYLAELFPTSFRFRGAGIANGIAKLLTVAMPILVAWVLTVTSAMTIFIGISLIALFAGIIVWAFGNETNQKVIR